MYAMSNLTVICFLSSLLSYGMGISKIFSLSNALTDTTGTYDVNNLVTIATVYFVLAIFFTIIGFLFHTSNIKENRKSLKLRDMDFSRNHGQEQELAS